MFTSWFVSLFIQLEYPDFYQILWFALEIGNIPPLPPARALHLLTAGAIVITTGLNPRRYTQIIAVRILNIEGFLYSGETEDSAGGERNKGGGWRWMDRKISDLEERERGRSEDGGGWLLKSSN